MAFYKKGDDHSRPPRRANPPRRPVPASRRVDGPAGDTDRPYGAKPYGDRPYGDKPRGDRPYGAKPYGDKPFGDKPRGDRPYGAKPYGDRPFGDKPRGDRPYGAKPYGDKPYGDKPRGDRPYGAKPYGDKPYGDKPRGDKPYGAKPYGDRPPRDRFADRDDRKPAFAPGNRPSFARPAPDARADYADAARRGDFAPAPGLDAPAADTDTPANILAGRNPIREALKAEQPLEKLLVAEGELSGSAKQIVAVARDKGVVVQFVNRARLDAIYPNHQGMLAFASAAEYATVEDILSAARDKGEDPFVVVLDGVTDPHNLGAIIRSCECLGAHGVIVMDRRSAGLTPATAKAAAGALAHIRVARVTNLRRTLDELKEKGLWITGTAADGKDISGLSLTGPMALVVGSEGEGMSRLVREACDQLAAIPLYGEIASLNASVACGIALYEIARARHA